MTLMGLQSLRDLPPYPTDAANWPVIQGTTQPALRFRWDEEWDSPINQCGLQCVLDWVCGRDWHGDERMRELLQEYHDTDVLEYTLDIFRQLQTGSLLLHSA
ncbi:hypothetical protein BDN72DRAFT_851107 [Pluteus cervinus]|uniref:Uncharacterized protein n=1 Tax=Pluteus cervinus TaxID=181527 RepID=A0ACD3A2U5_9AGAR|nr:hypothetical protein BDN72DRAFT_851107 [Pluteus cervinus]